MVQPLTATEPIPVEITNKIDDLNKHAWEVHITQPDYAIELSTEARSLCEKYVYKKGLAYAILNMGVCYRYLSNLEKALSLLLQSLDMFQELGEKAGEAQTYVSIATTNYYIGDFERSTDYFLKGIQLSEEAGNKEALAYAFNGAGYNFGIIFGDYNKGLDFLEKALLLANVGGMSNDLRPRVLDSMAELYLTHGQMEKAYEAATQCHQLSVQYSQRLMISDSLFTLGNICLKQERFNESKEYFLQSLSKFMDIGYKVGESNCLLQLGKLALREDNHERAKEYFLESLNVAEGIKAKAFIYLAHEALAELYEVKNDIRSFVKHYKLYHTFKSEVFKDEQVNKHRFQNIQHEIEQLKKEAEINRLTHVVMKEKNEELELKKEELEQSYNNISVLSKIGRDITSTLDLETILITVYEHVNELMDANMFGIGIWDPVENVIEYRLSIEEGKRYQPYKRNMSDKNQLAVWCIEQKKEVFINDIRSEFSKYLDAIDLTVLTEIVLEDGSSPKSPNSLIYLPLEVKDQIIGLISVQSYKINAYDQHHLDILKTLASYTAAALYNAHSYETLQHTLSELKLTQDQLVHSEKMASLGALTAGIAHEIQNPLNFVNNFSEVNTELIDEMRAELKEGNTPAAISLSNDIRDNQEKISHHGKRADAIVKGMLQHSRSSSGIKEPTDINALAEEYFRLAYHGLRAKDKSFNATMKTELDPSVGLINVIPQDIGRVILNLITNAFYAVAEKKKIIPQGYDPTVTVSTKKLKDKVMISVKDNGNGIPVEVVDKIFQPFFTTKPTGQGTGLGLSLSYDIVKAHRGEIKVRAMENEGTEFTIILPA